jgi:hypothetical protein
MVNWARLLVRLLHNAGNDARLFQIATSFSA